MHYDHLSGDDWCLIARALAHYGGPPHRTDMESIRCYELVDTIARMQGVPPYEFVR